MSGQPKRHHFVPQFYLIGFTKVGTAEGTLHVLDQRRLKQWSSTPANVALEKGFYSVDLPSVDAAVVERALSRLEAEFAPVVRNIAEMRSLPSDDAFGTLISFIAVMAARVPVVKSTISTFLEDVANKQEIMRREIARRQGYAEGAAESVEKHNETNEAASLCNQTMHVQLMLEMVPTLIPLLGERNWSLWELGKRTPEPCPCRGRGAGAVRPGRRHGESVGTRQREVRAGRGLRQSGSRCVGRLVGRHGGPSGHAAPRRDRCGSLPDGRQPSSTEATARSRCCPRAVGREHP